MAEIIVIKPGPRVASCSGVVNKSMTSSLKRILTAPVAMALMVWTTHPTRAQSVTPNSRRCAVRLAAAITGKGPTAASLADADPQGQVDALLATPDFVNRFSAYVNATYNDEPGMNQAQDAPYYLSKYVLENNRPWKDMFLGELTVALDDEKKAVVQADPGGLGYFRSVEWLKRYAGNEEIGLKISTAYRMINNVLGITMTATTNAPDADVSATGREAGACRGCHYDPWYGLDKISKVLTRRVGTGNKLKFEAPPAGDIPQQLVPGVTVANDKELIQALVNSEHFRFQQCRLAWRYLYGRNEHTSESAVFDECMRSFAQSGSIRDALSAIAKHKGFCR